MEASNASRMKFVRSTVDETLFGERVKARETVNVPEFEPPWVDRRNFPPKTPSKPLLFYCPTSQTRPSSRTRSAPTRGYKPVKFSPTHVDETLFGERRTKRSDSPPSGEFEPPWEKQSEKRRDRPLLFDCNSRLVFDNSSDELEASSRSRTPQSFRSSSRASSRSQSAGKRPNSAYKPPPWRWLKKEAKLLISKWAMLVSGHIQGLDNGLNTNFCNASCKRTRVLVLMQIIRLKQSVIFIRVEYGFVKL